MGLPLFSPEKGLPLFDSLQEVTDSAENGAISSPEKWGRPFSP
jgi:hypothetical protein